MVRTIHQSIEVVTVVTVERLSSAKLINFFKPAAVVGGSPRNFYCNPPSSSLRVGCIMATAKAWFATPDQVLDAIRTLFDDADVERTGFLTPSEEQIRFNLIRVIKSLY